MKVAIKTRLINTKSNDWSKQIIYDVTNESVKGIKTELDKQLKDHECEVHKNASRGTITLIASTSSKIIKVEYSNFCCQDFKNSINIKN